MFAVLYFMMIRPQTKQAKDHQQFLSTLQKGQEVSTSGGLVGKVHAVGADTVVVEIAKDVRVTVVRSHVYAWKAPAAPDKAAPSEKSAAEPKPAEAKK
ncbi:MAG: preprotein translocase subunit YajC [Deltaproteobacteria bacterium]|nr:preprotein translocase subunit YajC [Deltaproteobacteria bacterium]